ncbi:hypothetical protein [Subtercola boreus]|uniref:hypothetical protein n=1 Tax=Subtercola boreus TaxID=120213 RepID=UPI0011C083F7|nr:hypothetical protein [Subtercola boreus]
MGTELTRRVIRLSPDYGNVWSLWESSTPERPTNYSMKPSDYGLSEELADRLRRWHQEWDAQRLYEKSWDTPEQQERWNEEGLSIAHQLHSEVRHYADVSYRGELLA